MATKLNPKCMDCQTTESLRWEETGNQCHSCYEKKQENMEASKIKNEQEEVDMKMNEERKLRKSTRSTRYKYKSQTQTTGPPVSSNSTGSTDNSNGLSASHNNHAAHTSSGNNGGSSKSQSKSRSRRHIFKKAPAKLTLQATAETHAVESLFYKGTYMQVGDIVSLIDNDNNLYYAQIRGLLVDAYSEKSAYLTWLLPTTCSPDPKESFDPSTYLIGPDEDFSRKLSCLEFIMHAPSNYFHDRTTPFPLPDALTCSSKPGGYVWTHLPGNKCQKVLTH